MELLDIKPFQQTLYKSMCGPATLKMLFSYYGLEKSEEELGKLCGTDCELGTSAEQLRTVAESFGFIVEIKNLSELSDIEVWMEKKVPVIVDWFTSGRADYGESSVPDGHYSPVVGLDETYIYLQDPEIGKLRKIERNAFETVWFDFTGRRIENWDEMIVRQIIAIYK